MESTRTVLTLMLLAAAACGDSEREQPAGANRLDGVWTVEFTLRSPVRIGRASEDSIAGEIALLPRADLARTTGLSGAPTHSGSYTAQFRAFGFDLSGGREVPALVARLSGTDSVEIALQPARDAPVRLRGILSGDSIAGLWSYAPHRGGSASGSFVMRRSAEPMPPTLK